MYLYKRINKEVTGVDGNGEERYSDVGVSGDKEDQDDLGNIRKA